MMCNCLTDQNEVLVVRSKIIFRVPDGAEQDVIPREAQAPQHAPWRQGDQDPNGRARAPEGDIPRAGKKGERAEGQEQQDEDHLQENEDGTTA